MIALAEALGMKACVSKTRLAELECCNLPVSVSDTFTTDRDASRLHIVPLHELSFKQLPKLQERLHNTKYSRIVAFRPAGA